MLYRSVETEEQKKKQIWQDNSIHKELSDCSLLLG